MGNRRVKSLRLRDEVALLSTVVSLLRSGIDVQDAFSHAARTVSGRAGAFAKKIANALCEGASLADAADGCAFLHPVHRATLAVVDSTGDALALTHALDALTGVLAMRRKAVTASLYPLVVAALSFAGVVALIVFVVPAFERVVAIASTSSQTALASVGRRSSLVLAVAGLVFASLTVLTLALVRGSGTGGALGRIARVVPFVGRIDARIEALGFAHSVGALLEAGLTVDDAIALAARSTRDRRVHVALAAAARAVESGIAPSIALWPCFRSSTGVSQAFEAVEAGAGVRESMHDLERRVRDDLERDFARLTALVEPVMTAAAGGLVLVVVVALVRPLASLYAGLLP